MTNVFSHNRTEDPILDEAGTTQLSIEAIRAEVEDYAQRAYKMGKAAKEDEVRCGLADTAVLERRARAPNV